MVTSRGALNPSRTVPPRTSTTWTSMSSPILMVSPTLRVSVSMCTPPWVWMAVHGGARSKRAEAGRTRGAGRLGSLSAQGAPDRMLTVGQHDLAGQAAGRIDDERSPQVGRRPGDVPLGNADDAVHLRFGLIGQVELGTHRARQRG